MCNKNTGGILNTIATEKHSVTAKRTVKIMDLIKYHSPKSEKELLNLIEEHSKNIYTCACGCKSSGNIEHFAYMLHKDVLWYESENNIKVDKTYEDCYQFIYDLFITNSMYGNKMEQKAVKELSLLYPDFNFEQTDSNFDLQYSVDILIKNKNNEIIAGIQVKPISYKYVNQSFIQHNEKLNNNFKEKYGARMYYLYYEKNGTFTNLNKMDKK